MATDRNEMSRRQFTATTSFAAAAVVAGGASRVLGANDRVVLASIGIRGQGDALKQGFAKIPGVEIKTLCDIDENLFARRANDPELKDVATFKPGYAKDLRRVFDDKDIDGVIVATPNHWHALASIWALQAGKHVLCEKPLCLSVREIAELAKLRDRSGRHIEEAFVYRNHPQWARIEELLRDDAIGRVRAVQGTMAKQFLDPNDIRNNPALRGLNIPKTGQPAVSGVGLLVTKTLVISGDIQSTTTPEHPRGAMLRAYDKMTGEQVGAVWMPSQQSGSPMTYLHNGRQYIVVAIGGGNFPGELLAFALPQTQQ